MSKLKELIQDEGALASVIDANLPTIITRVKREVGALEAEYILYRKRRRYGSLILILGFLLPFIAAFLTGSEVFSGAAFFLGVIMIGFGLYFTLSGSGVIRTFNLALDRVLYQEVFSLFGFKGEVLEQTLEDLTGKQLNARMQQYLAKTPQVTYSSDNDSPRSRLSYSELITESFNRFAVDNKVKLNIGDSLLTWDELSISDVSGSGKNRSEKQVFKGYFVSATLNKQLQGKTFIAAEGDVANFSRTPFWSNKLTETVLEWNEFEDLLHVATSNEVEARYVLTPNFMHVLYDWWTKRQEQIRLSFIGNQLFILFPDNKVRFNKTVANLSEAELRDYLLAIATPMLHVIHLVEEVRL